MGVLDRRFLGCLFLLVLNDRFLKAEFGNWMTGKLSDFAGVVVFAVVIGQALQWLGVSERRARIAGASLSGISLIGVKVYAGAAAFVGDTAARFGLTYEIVVDPTDLVALLVLPLALSIMREPRELIDRGVAKRVAFVAGCFACLASGGFGPSVHDFVERTEEGTIVLGQRTLDDNETIEAVLESSPEGWVQDPELSDITWTLTQQSCSPVDSQVCIALGPGSRVSVSNDGGESYEPAWEVDDFGTWDPAETEDRFNGDWPWRYQATDVAWTDDGRAFVAMSDRLPVVRNVDGSFTPSIADLHLYPWQNMVFVLLGWFVVATGLWLTSWRESSRGATLFVTSAVFLFLGSVFLTNNGTVGLPALVALLGLLGVTLFCLALLRAWITKRENRQPDAFETVSVVRLLWPFGALLLFGLLWDIDAIGWFSMLGLELITVIVATKLAWVYSRPEVVAA